MDVEPGALYEVELERGSGLLMQWKFNVRVRTIGDRPRFHNDSNA